MGRAARLGVALAAWALAAPWPAGAQQDPGRGAGDGGAQGENGDDEGERGERPYIFQFTDDQGELHFVDDITLVPEQYRNGDLIRIPVERPDGAAAPGAAAPGAAAPPPPSRRAARDDDPPAGEARAAREQRDADRLAELRQRREELLRRMALLEEGYVDEGSGDLTDEELERLMVQSQAALERLDREIAALE